MMTTFGFWSLMELSAVLLLVADALPAWALEFEARPSTTAEASIVRARLVTLLFMDSSFHLFCGGWMEKRHRNYGQAPFAARSVEKSYSQMFSVSLADHSPSA